MTIDQQPSSGLSDDTDRPSPCRDRVCAMVLPNVTDGDDTDALICSNTGQSSKYTAHVLIAMGIHIIPECGSEWVDYDESNFRSI